MKELSKFFSYALRHAAADLSLSIDSEGWAAVSDLIRIANREGYQCNIEDVEKVVATNAKKRFQLRGLYIRAVQGHTTSLVDRTFQSLTPPETLYHGTATRFIESIMTSGLSKMTRQYVHLSVNTKIAAEVGRRYGQLQLLEINSGQMHRDGFTFFLSENNVWLVDSVPVKYIQKI